MRYAIDPREGYLRAELIERETPEETRTFGEAVQAAMREKGLARVLVVVRASRPIFRVEEYQLSEFLTRFADCRVHRRPARRAAARLRRRGERHAVAAAGLS